MKITPDLFTPLDKQNIEPQTLPETPPFWSGVILALIKNRMATASLFILGLLILFAIIGPLLNEYSYDETYLVMKNSPPSKQFWFGTDDLGRDMFTRTAYGARISLFIGITAALIDLVIGVVWGGFAGLMGGKIDEIMMRTVDVIYSLPYLLVVILISVVLGQGVIPILIAMTAIGWCNMSRIVRGKVLQLKNEEYVLAAYALGASQKRILFRHLLPNAIGPIIVTLTFTIPWAIFVEAFLSFLGLGVQAPIASWGTMTSDALPALRYYPWRLFFPSFFISLTILAFNTIGDGLRDVMDPKHKGQ